MTKEIGIPHPHQESILGMERPKPDAGHRRHLSAGKRFHVVLKVCPASFRDGHEHPLALTAWLFCLFSFLVFEIQSHVRWGSLGLCVYSFSQCGLSV